MNLIHGVYSRMLFLSFVLFISTIPNQFEATCYRYITLLHCRGKIPDNNELKLVGPKASVQISQFDGQLQVAGPAEQELYSVKSLQIQNSIIHHIEPLFFWAFSGGTLESLVLNAVSGTIQLNSATLGRLENVLTNIRVSGSPITDISYLANLTQLTTLHLGLIQLRAVPSNFGHLLSHLIKLDLSKNELTSLPWDAVARRVSSSEFKLIRLSDNPWHCDCTLQPLFELASEHVNKISGFRCETPKEFNGFTLGEFHAIASCKPSTEEQVVVGDLDKSQSGPDVNEHHGIVPAVNPDVHSGPVGERIGDEDTQVESGEVASAGLSTEVIAVIVAIVVVVVIVLIAVIAFKARQNSQRRQRASQKQPSQKSSPYCVVVEHSSPSRGGSGAPKAGNAGAHNNYGRDTDHIERQPLAPGYRDNRL